MKTSLYLTQAISEVCPENFRSYIYSPSSEADSHSADQETSLLSFMESEDSLPFSQELATEHDPEPD
jgi:hypothetical protein